MAENEKSEFNSDEIFGEVFDSTIFDKLKPPKTARKLARFVIKINRVLSNNFDLEASAIYQNSKYKGILFAPTDDMKGLLDKTIDEMQVSNPYADILVYNLTPDHLKPIRTSTLERIDLVFSEQAGYEIPQEPQMRHV